MCKPNSSRHTFSTLWSTLWKKSANSKIGKSVQMNPRNPARFVHTLPWINNVRKECTGVCVAVRPIPPKLGASLCSDCVVGGGVAFKVCCKFQAWPRATYNT